jgi:hypothetical protein
MAAEYYLDEPPGGKEGQPVGHLLAGRINPGTTRSMFFNLSFFVDFMQFKPVHISDRRRAVLIFLIQQTVSRKQFYPMHP